MNTIFINYEEILYLSIFFTLLAMYFNIHGKKHISTFVVSHIVSLLIALILSRILYNFLLFYYKYE